MLPFLKLASTTAVAALIGLSASAQTLVYCSEGSPEGFDPALYTSGTTFDASSHPIYNRLVEFKVGTTEVIPGLAESYEVSEDGLEYTFNLRQGVQFHTTDYFTPTRDFNADDVIFSFDRQGNPDNPYYQVSGGTWEYFNGMSMPDLIKEIVRVDDYTVKFVLNRPEAPFVANMAMDFASIVSAEYAQAMLDAGTPENLNQAPIGTGPFEFVAYQKDAVIRYTRNVGYWAGDTALENLVFAITPDASVRYQKLQANECQVMPYPNPADIAAMEADENITMMSQEGLNPIPPTMWSYNNDIEDYPFDPEKAREMLAAEGVENLSMEIWAMPVQRPYNPNARRMAEMMQADLANIGVEVEIVSYEWGEYLERSKALDRAGAVLLGCDGVGGSNRAQWCNPEFQALIDAAKVTSDVAERTRLYEEAQVVFKAQAPWLTIAHSVVFMPVRNEVEGYVVHPLGGHIFTNVSLAE